MKKIIHENIEIIQDKINPMYWKYIDTEQPYKNWLYGVDAYDDNITTSIGIKNLVERKEVLLFATGGCSGAHDTCFLVRESHLLICVGDTVFCLDKDLLEVNWMTKCDWATCFQILKFKQGYIIHGELQITYLSFDGEIIWTFSGRDIFVTGESNNECRIVGDEIHLLDWNEDKYILNADGILIA